MATNILLDKADELAYRTYKETKLFPKDEQYGLTSQIRRSSLSVPLNIVEGYARQSRNEYRRFLEIAYGSLKETKYLLHFANREGYIDTKTYNELIHLTEEVGKMTWASIHKMKK
jgi:four helix bundle protein